MEELIKIEPIVIDFLKKLKATQFTWNVISITRNENASAETIVKFFNENSIEVSSTIIEIPSEILKVWVDNSVIDNYIAEYLELKIIQKQPEEKESTKTYEENKKDEE